MTAFRRRENAVARGQRCVHRPTKCGPKPQVPRHYLANAGDVGSRPQSSGFSVWPFLRYGTGATPGWNDPNTLASNTSLSFSSIIACVLLSLHHGATSIDGMPLSLTRRTSDGYHPSPPSSYRFGLGAHAMESDPSRCARLNSCGMNFSRLVSSD